MTVTTRPRAHKTGPCTAIRHTPTNSTWNLGCRCPGTIAAHDQWLIERRALLAAIRRTSAETGVCAAPSHGTVYAYEEVACRCQASIDAYRAKRNSAGIGDWRYWRGPQTKVSRINMLMVLDGVAAESTRAERRLAVEMLSRRMVPGIGGPQPMSPAVIARRLGIHEQSIYRLRGEREVLAERRPERRAADARMKNIRARAAAGRRDAERERHEAAHLERMGHKMHYRTVRRLRASQERAKRVALAIERRARFH